MIFFLIMLCCFFNIFSFHFSFVKLIFLVIE
nr:MAG TPA: hypothetical protein [Herelleviridae sp.]